MRLEAITTWYPLLIVYLPLLVTIAEIKTMTQSNLERKGFVQFAHPHHSPSLSTQVTSGESQRKNSSRNLEAATGAEVMRYTDQSLVCSPWHLQLCSYMPQNHLGRERARGVSTSRKCLTDLVIGSSYGGTVSIEALSFQMSPACVDLKKKIMNLNEDKTKLEIQQQ